MLLLKKTSVLLLVTGATASSTSSLRPKQNKGASTLTLPLLKHHDVVERRRRELRDAGIGEEVDENPQYRRKAFYETEPQITQLFQGYGTHYVDLYIGTPPQRQTLIIDTADDLTAFPCQECQDCGDADAHTNPAFDEYASRTFQRYNCKDCSGQCIHDPQNPDNPLEFCAFQADYGADGSFSAYKVKDLAYFGGPHDTALSPQNWEEGMSGAVPDQASAFTFRLTFGCKVTDTGLFQTQLANGIAGMGPSDTAIWNQMKWDSVVPDAGFSLCFAPHRQAPTKEGVGAGAITFGGTDLQLHKTPMVYAKDSRLTQTDSPKYGVQLRKVYLRRHGGESVEADSLDEVLFELRDINTTELNKGGVIIDSFTTGTYMRDILEEPFREQWNKIVDFEYTNDPLSLSAEEVAKLPTILIQIESADEQIVDVSDPYSVTGLAGELGEEDTPTDIVVAVPPQHYMLYNPNDDTYHASFRFLDDQFEGVILGANFLMGHDVHFDVDKKRIGFSESTCDYEDIVEDAINDYAEYQQKTLEEQETLAASATLGSTEASGRNEWNSKCGGWCFFGKFAAGTVAVVAAVGSVRLYRKYQLKQFRRDIRRNSVPGVPMPGMNERGEQWSPQDKLSNMPGRVVEHDMAPLPSRLT